MHKNIYSEFHTRHVGEEQDALIKAELYELATKLSQNGDTDAQWEG